MPRCHCMKSSTMTHSVCPGEFPTAPRPGKRPGHAPTAQEASPHTQHPGLEVRPQVSGQTQGPPSALDPSESLWSSGCLVQLARHPLGCPHPTCRCLGSSPSCLRGRGHGARTSSCRGLEEVQTDMFYFHPDPSSPGLLARLPLIQVNAACLASLEWRRAHPLTPGGLPPVLATDPQV